MIHRHSKGKTKSPSCVPASGTPVEKNLRDLKNAVIFKAQVTPTEEVLKVRFKLGQLFELVRRLWSEFWPSLKRIFKTAKRPKLRFADNHEMIIGFARST